MTSIANAASWASRPPRILGRLLLALAIAGPITITTAAAQTPAKLASERKINLQATFGSHWGKAASLQSALKIDLAGQREFSLRFADITIRRQGMMASVTTPSQWLGSLMIGQDVTSALVLLATDSRSEVSAQLVLLDRAGRYIAATPIATQPIRRAPASTVTIQPYIRSAIMAFAVVDRPSLQQPVRSASHCWDQPVLAAIEYAIGKCPVSGKGGFYETSSGKDALLTPAAGTVAWRHAAATTQQYGAGIIATLGETLSSQPYSLAFHAAARTCHTTLDKAIDLPKRGRTDDGYACMAGMSNLIAGYLGAYAPRYWNPVDFKDILDDVFALRKPRYAATDAAAAKVFALVVTDLVRQGFNRSQMTAAFHAANVLYMQSAFASFDPEWIAARYSTDPRWLRFADAIAASKAPIGVYAIDTRQSDPPATHARMRFNGQWIKAPEPFEVDIVRQNNPSQRAGIEQLLNTWESQFRSAGEAEKDLQRRQLLGFGQSLAASMAFDTNAARDASAVIMTVSWRGEIMAVLRGRIGADRMAEIHAVASAPSTLRVPFVEGAIGGAPAIAIREFLSMATSNASTTTFMHAITPPSAKPARYGFQLTE